MWELMKESYDLIITFDKCFRVFKGIYKTYQMNKGELKKTKNQNGEHTLKASLDRVLKNQTIYHLDSYKYDWATIIIKDRLEEKKWKRWARIR